MYISLSLSIYIYLSLSLSLYIYIYIYIYINQFYITPHVPSLYAALMNIML